MKKKLLIILIITFFFTTVNSSFAQRVKGVLIGGFNISQIAGDEVAGYKRFGFNGGIGGMMPLDKNERWLFGLEALINQKGSYEDNYFMYYNTRLTYAEVPVLIHFVDKIGGFTFGAGLSYGRLIATPKEEAVYREQTVQITNKEYSKNDLSVLLDVRFKIWRQLKFNFRFAYSIIPIKSDIEYNNISGTGDVLSKWERNFYNNVLTFRLLWVFNEKETTKRKSRR